MVISMGKVITVIKVYPDEGVEAESLAVEVKKIPECTNTKVEEIAFGAKAVIASFVCEDSEGKDFEETIQKIAGVSGTQVEECGLL